MKPSLLIGSTGQVAKALQAALSERGVTPLLASSKSEAAFHLDLSKPESIRALFSQLDARFPDRPFQVFLNGAMTHVDRCEDEKEQCRRTNEIGPGLVAEECARRGHRLVHFSTEYVFGEAEYRGGALGPFSEEDPPAPTSWYGECKWRGEERVRALLGNAALILRTTMVFSWDPEGNNALMQYLQHLSRIRDGESPPVFRVPRDQISTPTYAPWLAEATLRLLELGEGGVFNLVGDSLLSRQELVEKVIRIFGFDRDSSLAGFRFLPTAELGQRAKRPLTAGLRMEKAKARGLEVWSIDRALLAAKALRDRA